MDEHIFFQGLLALRKQISSQIRLISCCYSKPSDVMGLFTTRHSVIPIPTPENYTLQYEEKLFALLKRVGPGSPPVENQSQADSLEQLGSDVDADSVKRPLFTEELSNKLQ